MKTNILIITLAVVSLCSLSCRSVNYRERAVERARQFALDNTLNLSEIKRDYIRYAPPRILDKRLFAFEKGSENSDNNKRGTGSKYDLMHTCIIWDIPDLEYSVVIFGTCNRKMDNWYPNRLIRKKYIQVDYNYVEAVEQARKYVMNNMLFLSDGERNRVRFAEPKAVISSFDLPKDEDVADSDDRVDIRTRRWNLDRKEEAKRKPVQISFVWSATDTKKVIVVIGNGDSSIIDGQSQAIEEDESSIPWKVIKGVVMTGKELSKHTTTTK